MDSVLWWIDRLHYIATYLPTYLPILPTYLQGSSSKNVTILAANGYRHFLKNQNIMQVLGVTMSGEGGASTTRGGVEFGGETAAGM